MSYTRYLQIRFKTPLHVDKTIELHNDSTKVWPVPRRFLQGEVCHLAERFRSVTRVHTTRSLCQAAESLTLSAMYELR